MTTRQVFIRWCIGLGALWVFANWPYRHGLGGYWHQAGFPFIYADGAGHWQKLHPQALLLDVLLGLLVVFGLSSVCVWSRHGGGRSRYAVAAIAFVALGYLSTALSLSRCERNTERWIRDLVEANPEEWRGSDARSEPAELTWPWFASTGYTLRSREGEEPGTRHYVCLLGLPIPVANR